MITPEKFLTNSLQQADIGNKICKILAAAINAVDPESAIIRSLRKSGNTLHVGEHRYKLDEFRNIYVIGAGKASYPMLHGVITVLRRNITKGIVVVKEGNVQKIGRESLPAELEIVEASHPLPDRRGVEGTSKIIDLLSQTTDDDLVLTLISGGGSALLTYPVTGVTLADLQSTTSILLACGATIHQINKIRKHLDIVKGGQLARLASPATIISLLLSDVVGNDLDIIASGPTVPDPYTFQDAIDTLADLNILDKVPNSVSTYLIEGSAGLHADTPKSNDPLFTRVQNQIVGSNRVATDAACTQARREGLNTLLLTNYLQGEASQIGKVLAAISRQIAQSDTPVNKPACIILGGESTVTIKGSGSGGRNQEMALSAVEDIAGLDNTIILTLATDGGDGTTDAAGAVVTGNTYSKALSLGINPKEYLKTNDSFTFFSRLSDLIKTGPTQTNVNDLIFIFSY